jgi:hypothetical protein
MSNKGSSSGPSPLHIAFASPPQIAIPTRPSNRVSGPRRRGNLPTARAQPANDFPSTFNWGSNNSKVFNTEPGDTPLSMALVLRQDPEAQVWMYQGEITKLFSLIEGWVKTYASVPNLTNDSAIARSNDILWAYMMNCTYPGHRQDSHTHVMALLSEARTRFWFVMRMACQYCVKDMMSLEAFLGFSIPVDNRLNEAKLKLLERGRPFLKPSPLQGTNA